MGLNEIKWLLATSVLGCGSDAHLKENAISDHSM
jgi:hypothetical protein